MKLSKRIGLPLGPLLFVIIQFLPSTLVSVKADAVITDQVKLPIAVLTADCVPVLLYDYKRKMIAAIHAGWKGAYKGIIKKVISFMLKKGCGNKSITAAIGPCIQQNSYNVGAEFKKKFIKKNKKNKIFFKKKKKELYFNLPSFVKFQLKNRLVQLAFHAIDHNMF